jgi:polyisoprenoid-binding protein YceI
MRIRLAFVTLLLVAQVVLGAQGATWTIDPAHSAVHFSVRHMLVSNARGEFNGPTGTVRFDPQDLTSLQVDATIDAATINTRHAVRDRDLKGADFFDVVKHPRITFKSRRAEPVSPGRFKLVGDLTMRGVTREVTLDVEGPSPAVKDSDGNRRIGATATTSVDRREFGLLYNELIEGGGAVVGNQVTITIDLEMTRPWQ